MTLRFEDVKAIVEKIACRGTLDIKITLREADHADLWLLSIEAPVIDVTDPEFKRRINVKVDGAIHAVYGTRANAEKDIVYYVHSKIRELFLHELNEQFTYQGERIFDPHEKERNWE